MGAVGERWPIFLLIRGQFAGGFAIGRGFANRSRPLVLTIDPSERREEALAEVCVAAPAEPVTHTFTPIERSIGRLGEIECSIRRVVQMSGCDAPVFHVVRLGHKPASSASR